MKKFIIYISCFIAISFVIDRTVGTFLGKCYFKTLPLYMNNNINYSYFHQGNEDLAIFGSSKANHHYVPEVLKDSLNMSIHNYGMDGHNIYSYYVLLQMVLEKRNYPRYVILDLTERDLLKTPVCNTERISAFNTLYGKHLAVDSIMNIRNSSYRFSLRHISLYRYNSLLHKIILDNIFSPAPTLFKHDGYIPLYSDRSSISLEVKSPDEYEIDYLKLEYVEKFVKLCKDKEVHILLVNSPSFIKYDSTTAWVAIVERLAKQYNIDFLNYDNCDEFLNSPHFFKDQMHLCDKGARVFSSQITSMVKSNFMKISVD